MRPPSSFLCLLLVRPSENVVTKLHMSTDTPVVSGLVSSWVAKRIGAARRDWNKDVETRVAETSKVLSQIKSIKATGLSPLMKRRLQDLQVKEMKTSLKERHLRVSLHCMGKKVYLQVCSTCSLTTASQSHFQARWHL